MLYVAGAHQPFVGVLNIGTGNCIALYNRNGNILAYVDFGSPWVNYATTVPPAAPVPCVCDDPVFILSHWDFDHLGMARRVPACYAMRWIAPQQYMGPASARDLYARVLLNLGAGGALYLWTSPAGGVAPQHVMFAEGYLERATGPVPHAPGGRNDSSIVAYVRVREAVGAPLRPPTGLPLFAGPRPPVGAGPPAPLPAAPPWVPPALPGGVALPLAGAFPPYVAPPAGGGPVVNGNAPAALPVIGGAGRATVHPGDRYVLLPGDAGFQHIPSQQPPPPAPPVVGLVPTHHGSDSWIPAGAVAGPAAIACIPAYPPAVALPAVIANPYPVPAPAPAPFPPASQGRCAYSYGIRPPAGIAGLRLHAYGPPGNGHPRPAAIAAYQFRGWDGRLNTALDDYRSRQPYSSMAPIAAPIVWAPGVAAAPLPPGHQRGNIALGWQETVGPAGLFEHPIDRDLLPAGPQPFGAALNRLCATCGTPRVFVYR